MSKISSCDISVVVPVYNSERSLRELVTRIQRCLDELGMTRQIILVNDCSSDGSWEAIEDISHSSFGTVIGIDLLRNHGQDVATLCGMAHATGYLVVTLDDDLQQPPEELNVLYAHLMERPDLDAVVGTWDRDQGILRNIGTRINALLDRISNGTPRSFHHTSFRMMRRPTVDAIVDSRTRTPIVWALLTQSTARVENVEVGHEQRQHGRSGYTLYAAVRLVMKNFLQGTTLPLRLLSMVGFMSASIAILLIGLLVIRWAAGVATPPGWASSTLAVAFFGGMSLFGLGLIGEYLRLLMIEAREPPRWSVRRVTGEYEGGSKGTACEGGIAEGE